ncbi:MAG: FAD:protein FMN transferase [Bacteroidota bacterium]|nr:FAD:protein FMN transferase [Bacteroidota bacterium]
MIKIITVLFIVVLSSAFFVNPCNAQKLHFIRFGGVAQGGTYSISYYSTDSINYKKEIDSILNKIDYSLSIYNPQSIISRINKNEYNVSLDKYFIDNFKKAIEMAKISDGIFDPTIAPLVNAWGFGFKNKIKLDSTKVDSIKQYVNYKFVKLENNRLVKAKKEVMLDFNAIAQGYSVDVVGDFLESRNINNYIVEIGGELKAKGRKENNKYWVAGIERPEADLNNRKLMARVELKDKALATSGNYHKFFIENGQKYSHSINPKTGYPAKNSLLSVTVLADDCFTADSHGTFFMILGKDKTIEYLKKHKNIQAYMIYSDDKGNLKTWESEELKFLILEQK